MAAGTNPIDLAGALAQYSAALQSGLGASNQALDAQMAALNAGGDGQRGALLQLAAGFLSPTRTGSFGESLGNAVGNYATADATARQAQMDRALKLAQIQQARASLMMEGAGSQFELAQKAYELQRQGRTDDLFSSFLTGGGGLQDDMPGALSTPIVDSTFQYGAMYNPDATVARVNAVPSPLPEPAPAPALDTPLPSPDTFFSPPAGIRASVTPPSPMPYPSVPLDVPEDPLTPSLMGPPAGFGPRPDIPAGPQPLRRVPESDLPAVGANPAQARAAQPGFVVPGGEQSLLSPNMALPPERMAPMRERAAQMRGQRGAEAPAAPNDGALLGIPRPPGAFGRAYDDLTRILGPEGERLYAADEGRAAELEKRLWDRLERSPDYQRALEMGKGTSAITEYLFARRQGYDGSFTQFQNEGRRAAADRVVVDNRQDNAFAKEAGQGVAQRMFATLDDAQTQEQRLASYERIGSLLLQPEVFTGTGAEAITAAKRAASTLFGIEGIEGVENAEAAKRIGAELFAGFRTEMLSGATSNTDREMVMKIPPNITDSAAGIQLLIELQRRKTDIARQKAAIWDDLIREDIANGGDGNLGVSSLVEYRSRSAALNVFDEQDAERAMSIARENARQTGPFAGLDLDRVPDDILSDALNGYIQRDELEAFINNQDGGGAL